MTAPFRRLTTISAVGLLLCYATVMSTATSNAAQCGPGTVYEAATDSCVGVPPPPPPLPPPPPGDPTPGFSIGICAPIPFVSLCTGI
jgi:hypothetical protein